jgi:GTP-binding protein HflX
MAEENPKALLAGAYLHWTEKEACEEHLDELAFLAETAGVESLEKITCHTRKVEAGTFFTSGKLQELVDRAKELKADLVIVDNEISPTQQRNLEKAFGISVMDRTELILGVFEQRAQTKEARLQVELAEHQYQLPRLRKMWSHLHRQRGGTGSGGVYVKGEGEKQIELDRRILEDKILRLKKEIREVEKHRETQRSQRKKTGIPTFAIIGYTNAGKSTLLNALTDAGVFVEDKLFATLDTTTRKYTLDNNQEVLLTDTVGFIRKLPHLLVAAFKGTLEESMHADVLLHIIDVSDRYAEEHSRASYEVLSELNVEHKPVITVLNKVDKLQEKGKIIYFRTRFTKTVSISALTGEGFEELRAMMLDELSKMRKKVVLRVPQSDFQVVAEVMQKGNILKKEYDENDIVLEVELPHDLYGRFERYVSK